MGGRGISKRNDPIAGLGQIELLAGDPLNLCRILFHPPDHFPDILVFQTKLVILSLQLIQTLANSAHLKITAASENQQTEQTQAGEAECDEREFASSLATEFHLFEVSR